MILRLLCPSHTCAVPARVPIERRRNAPPRAFPRSEVSGPPPLKIRLSASLPSGQQAAGYYRGGSARGTRIGL